MLSHDDFFNTDMPGAFDVTYWPHNGDPIKTVAFIDRDVEFFPGGFESTVAERRTEITFRMDQVSCVERDETITTADETFVIKNEVDNDSFALKVAVI